MNSKQFEAWLRRTHGVRSFEKKGTGHKALFNPANGNWSQIPMHGGRKQLGKGLINKILKDLGIE